MNLLTVEDARQRMLAWTSALPAETVALGEAAGRVLAEDVVALRDQPPYPASAMDGWDKVIGPQLDSCHGPCNMVELMPRLLER